MTDEMMTLRALLEKSSDADLLREMIGFTAQRLMELEVESKTGAGYGEKSAERLAQRNGYRDRLWERRALAPWSCVFRSCAKAATFRLSWSRADWRRRR
jgi:transposase-like protein